MYSFLSENIGRQLIGASQFDSRKDVVQDILEKYPTPKSLAIQLKSLSNQETDPKNKQRLLNLAIKCSKIKKDKYPKFVKSICGYSKIWGIAGLSVGMSGIGGALGYVSGSSKHYSDNKTLNMMSGDFNTQRKMDIIKNITNKINNNDLENNIPLNQKYKFI